MNDDIGIDFWMQPNRRKRMMKKIGQLLLYLIVFTLATVGGVRIMDFMDEYETETEKRLNRLESKLGLDDSEALTN